jgi:AraC-like DNA-binding protein
MSLGNAKLKRAVSDRPAPAPKHVPLARSEVLHGFVELVLGLGGDPQALFEKNQIDQGILDDPSGLVPYRSMVRLLESAALELDCTDFGMRLANSRRLSKIVTPIDLVMRNSRTLGDALQYCADNVHVYSDAMQLSVEPLPHQSCELLKFEIVLERLPHQRQAVEHALALMYRSILHICGEAVHPREIWFAHDAAMPLARYRSTFSVPVRFGQPMNGLVFASRDFSARMPNPDRQLYEMATSFIVTNFPKAQKTLSAKVRDLISRDMQTPSRRDLFDDCRQERIAGLLGVHPRTLQRRLREEGISFEVIKDSVRRDAALHYLRERRLPLVHVAQALGYAEVSTLSRSCHRWFAASPKQLRKNLSEHGTQPARSRVSDFTASG